MKIIIDRAQTKIKRGETLRKNNEVNRVISRKLLNLRKERGLSRVDLAAKIGVSHQQIAKYESNASVLSVGRLLLIAKALDVGLYYFFNEFNPEAKVAENESFGMAFMKLSNKHKEGINCLVRLMVN